ncbi:MAG: nucleotidyltransferase family protein [Candidatus Marinimicrobia bacterium]|nr:nucleotidyltransferase family protein [Candidatus Neomarinimicrobiota bacterium]
MSAIVEKLRQYLPELEQHYQVKSLGVFGSWARGEQRKGSDLDVLVEFGENGPTLLGFVHLENYLSELLGIKIDLVEKDTLKPEIGRRILEEVLSI